MAGGGARLVQPSLGSGHIRLSGSEDFGPGAVLRKLQLGLRPAQLRRGTHVNVLVPDVTLDPELALLAQITHEEPGLGAVAAGLVDGRQLDEITLFVIGSAAIALTAV